MNPEKKPTTSIVINGRFLTRPISGVERVAGELLAEIDRRADSDGVIEHNGRRLQFSVALPSEGINHSHQACKNLKTKVIPYLRRTNNHGHLWEQVSLNFSIGNAYLLNLANSAPIFRRKQSIFIHDAAIYAVPDAYAKNYRRFYKLLYATTKVTRPNIITNSKFSRSEIKKYIGLEDSEVDVINLGADNFRTLPADDSIILKHGLEKIKFLLAVSSVQANKNFAGIVDALKSLGDAAPYCVIVGNSEHPSFKVMKLEAHPKLIRVGRVPDAQLKSLYSHAVGLVYPSFYEGFGLPPLEAIVAGTLPLVSRCASLPEVCGDNGFYCDPNDIHSIATGMAELIDMPIALRTSRLRISQEHVAKYSWSIGTVQLLDHLAKNVKG